MYSLLDESLYGQGRDTLLPAHAPDPYSDVYVHCGGRQHQSRFLIRRKSPGVSSTSSFSPPSAWPSAYREDTGEPALPLSTIPRLSGASGSSSSVYLSCLSSGGEVEVRGLSVERFRRSARTFPRQEMSVKDTVCGNGRGVPGVHSNN